MAEGVESKAKGDPLSKGWKSKVMVRGFPPGTSQEKMLSEVIEPWLSSIDYISFVPGKKPQPFSGKPVRTGFANLNFTDPEALLDFSSRCTGLKIRDDDGYEGMLAVMLSPFQQVPPPPSNAGNTVVDPLCGTYESTEEYQAFLKEEAEAASAPPAAPLPLDRQLEVMMEQERMLNPWKYSAELGKQTPLLEFLRTTGAGGDDGKGKERKVKREKKKKVKDEQQPIPLNATEDKRGPLKVKSKAKQQTQQQAQPASSAVPVATIEKQAPPLKIMSRPKTNNPTKTAAATTKAKPETTATPAVVGGAGPKVFTTSSKKTQQGSQQHAKPPLTSQHQQQYPQQQKKKEAQ